MFSEYIFLVTLSLTLLCVFGHFTIMHERVNGMLQPYSGWAFSGLLTDGRARGQKGPLPKICHTYPTIMKLGRDIPYLKKTPQKI